MKIAVLTMVFNNNYGGYLQCYALMETLKNLGHNPELLYVQTSDNSYKNKLKSVLKDYVFSIFSKKFSLKKIEINTRYFEKKYINPKTAKIFGSKDFERYSYGYDAYIVGSDQVWRPTMYPYIEQAFFGFVKDKKSKRLSYAASLGVDEWEYTPEQTSRFKKQIESFDAVSVREISSVDLLKTEWNIEAEHVLDPVMLLDIDHYSTIVAAERETLPKGELLTYILDPNKDKSALIQHISEGTGFKPFTVSRESDVCPYSSVTSWISGFINAKYVITDSFHGCVFSILFNKPFIVYGNEKRGLSRFYSILKLFDLEDRLVLSLDKFDKDLVEKNIDWEAVNHKLSMYKRFSIDFLRNNLMDK